MTHVINLDALVEEPKVAIVFKGKRHEMLTPTVGAFIENVKTVQSLAIGGGTLEEIEVMITIILRAFPTMVREDVASLSFSKLQSIANLARTGEIATTDEAVAKASEGSENPTPAKGS